MAVPYLRADLTVLIGEPFGSFGTMMPVGHTAIYLDRVCADGPLHLRMCHPGEPQGVVLARYHAIGQLDWIASPVLQFLYAADTLEDVLPYATPKLVWDKRQTYRHRFLGDLVPDGTERGKLMEEWWESAGVAYNRRLWAYQINTTPQQDQRFIDTINARPNRHLYHLKKTNCADFAAEMVNLFFPGLVHNDRIADFGLMTPKQVARSVAAYGAAHPEANLHIWEIPQVPGSLVRSKPVRGGAEAGLKTKRYLFTLAIIQPEVPATLFVLYLKHGRWKVGDGAIPAPDLPAQIAQANLPTNTDLANASSPQPLSSRPEHTGVSSERSLLVRVESEVERPASPTSSVPEDSRTGQTASGVKPTEPLTHETEPSSAGSTQ